VPTGTGSINPRATRSLEYIAKGDVATVAVQYSYYPSSVSFLIDRESAARAGRALIEVVHEQWAELDEASRPTLVVFGESLGSYGVESALPNIDELADKTDGVLLIGPPGFNPLRENLTRGRDRTARSIYLATGTIHGLLLPQPQRIWRSILNLRHRNCLPTVSD
jgi:uncharacterized membrane protein